MKKSSILFLITLLIFDLQTGAQSDKTGTVVENLEGELLLSDPLNGKQYYKVIPFSMKKGDAVLFKMKSNAFIPHILFATNQAFIVMGQINESRTESKVTFLAPADTSFFVVFTSMEENKTGKYSYDYHLLSADQVTAINDAKKNPVDRFATGNLGKQLIELLDYAKDGFKAIKGQKIKTEKNKSDELYAEEGKLIADKIREVTSIINYYKSSYSLENAKENNIIETFPNETNRDISTIEFVAMYGSSLTKDRGEDIYDKLAAHIKQELPGWVIKEFKDEHSNGGYSKHIFIKRDNNYQKHTITLDILLIKGTGIVSSDNATVRMTVK